MLWRRVSGCDERKLPSTEMKMLCMICDKTQRNGIGNKTIRKMTGMEKLEKFLREQKVQWFRHIERMDYVRAPVKAKKFVAVGSKGRKRV